MDATLLSGADTPAPKSSTLAALFGGAKDKLNTMAQTFSGGTAGVAPGGSSPMLIALAVAAAIAVLVYVKKFHKPSRKAVNFRSR